MTSPNAILKEEFARAIEKAAKEAYAEEVPIEQILATVSIPEPGFGDISSSIAFKLANKLKVKPNAIANRIVENINQAKQTGLIKEATNTKGYINARVNEQVYAQMVIETILEEGNYYGSSNIGKNEKVIVEYPSVNPTKPWHIGHLRNALLGEAISNLLEFCGYRVERENYIDDLGLQVAETVWGYLHIGSDPKGKKFDQFLGEQYVEVNKHLEKESVKKEVEEILAKMEQSSSEEAKLAREVSERCVKAQYETSFAYGIYHDVLMWESDIVRTKLLDAALRLGFEKGLIEKKEAGEYANCIVFDLAKAKGLAKEFENPKERYKVLVRSNGVATYAMKDFAFHLWKLGMLNADFKFQKFIDQPNGKPLYSSSEKGSSMEFGNTDKAINIIDMSQSAEQAVVRALISYLAGEEHKEKEVVHVAYGKVRLAEGTLSGRKGTWIGEERNYTADDLLAEAIKKTLEKTKESKKLSTGKAEEIEEVAREVAIGAVKFEYLKVSPEKEIVFSWESALNLEANSGPYIMYTYARAESILEKSKYQKHALTIEDYSHIGRAEEFELVKLLGMAQETVENACRSYRPNVIADYLLQIASLFSRFYEKYPVIQGGDAKEVRLAVVFATKQTIANMLRLLGIKPIKAI